MVQSDAGSTTAVRELHEETGYGTGKQDEGGVEVRRVSEVFVKDPGCALSPCCMPPWVRRD